MHKLNFLKPSLEIKILNEGRYSRVIGIDEVGRGCWAGPVAVGAYIYDSTSIFIEGLNDSKKIIASRREILFKDLNTHSHKVIFGEVNEIDQYGIGKMIEKMIQAIVDEFNDEKTFFLIDGQFSANFGPHSKKIIRGDGTYYSIAAASILAKVRRDALMTVLDSEYQGYGFKKHKGYGTKDHRNALSLLGISKIHRRSYKPIKMYEI